jgi:tRNA/rRNA methyltransferase
MKGLHFSVPDWYERVRFVLVRPSHPGNVGAAARAMRVMGLGRLVVVEPRFPGVLAHPEAVAFASGAVDLLGQAREVATLEEAIEDVSLAIAVSAQGREFGPQPLAPELIVEQAHAELASAAAHRVAFVFGTERTGLSIEEVSRCQALLAIPTAPGYGSLNLAQAVQVLGFALAQRARAEQGRLEMGQWVGAVAAQDGCTDGARDRLLRPEPGAPRYATQQHVAALFEHLEQALIDIEFVDPRHPKKLMPRLRRLLSRTRLEIEEVDLLRGICTQMQKTAGKKAAS